MNRLNVVAAAFMMAGFVLILEGRDLLGCKPNRSRPFEIYRSIFLSINSAAFLAEAATSLPSMASTITCPVISLISGTLITGGFHWGWPISKDFIVLDVQSGWSSLDLYSFAFHADALPAGTPARSAPRQLFLLVAHWMNSQAAFCRSGALVLLMERLQFETWGSLPAGPAGMTA